MCMAMQISSLYGHHCMCMAMHISSLLASLYVYGIAHKLSTGISSLLASLYVYGYADKLSPGITVCIWATHISSQLALTIFNSLSGSLLERMQGVEWQARVQCRGKEKNPTFMKARCPYGIKNCVAFIA